MWHVRGRGDLAADGRIVRIKMGFKKIRLGSEMD
jgi:hypothetical protein